MDRHVMLDNIELVLLTLDEVVDGGYAALAVSLAVCGCVGLSNWSNGVDSIILEVDTPSISNRVLMRVRVLAPLQLFVYHN